MYMNMHPDQKGMLGMFKLPHIFLTRFPGNAGATKLHCMGIDNVTKGFWACPSPLIKVYLVQQVTDDHI